MVNLSGGSLYIFWNKPFIISLCLEGGIRQMMISESSPRHTIIPYQLFPTLKTESKLLAKWILSGQCAARKLTVLIIWSNSEWVWPYINTLWHSYNNLWTQICRYSYHMLWCLILVIEISIKELLVFVYGQLSRETGTTWEIVAKEIKSASTFIQCILAL